MAANKLVREPGKYFDCTSMHGKWCTITLVGQDVGYARVEAEEGTGTGSS